MVRKWVFETVEAIISSVKKTVYGKNSTILKNINLIYFTH